MILRKFGDIALLVLPLLTLTPSGKTETREVCTGDDFIKQCENDGILFVTQAEYGRGQMGKCITKEEPHMGCTSNVLPLLDRWCSGRNECEFEVPNPDLVEQNRQSPNACFDYLNMYMELKYDCLLVQTTCSGGSNKLQNEEGFLSSHVTDQSACGSSMSPWIITVPQGKTVNMALFDFVGDNQGQNLNYVTCQHIYGYVVEKSLGINQTICGGRSRQRALYSSKTNNIEIHLRRRRGSDEPHFLIKYSANGCSDLTCPANAWYKREGNEAVIGCETNDQEWRLTCTGNTWQGNVGNCSNEVVAQVEMKSNDNESGLGFASMIIMTGIACGVFVAVVVAVMCGVIYVKKYRMKQETKRIQTTYATMEKQHSYYRPQSTANTTATDASSERLVDVPGTWLQSDTFGRHGTMASYPEQCMCPTLPGSRA